MSDADYGQFVNLLNAFSGMDNVARNAAEQAYKNLIQTQCDLALRLLARAACDGSLSLAARGQAYIGLQNSVKLIPSTDFNPALGASGETISFVQAALKHAFLHEPEHSLRRRVQFCICSFASLFLPQQKWNDLLPFMMENARQGDPLHRSSALRILATMVLDLSGPMEPLARPLTDLLQPSLSMNDPSVQEGALELFGCLLTMKADAETGVIMNNTLPMVMRGIIGLLDSGRSDGAVVGLDGLISIAETEIMFLRNHVPTLVANMIAIAEREDVPRRVGRMAMEFIMQVAEERVGLLRRQEGVMERVLPLLLRWMTAVDDLDFEEWEAIEVDMHNRHVRVARDDLDRLAVAFGDEAFRGLLFHLLAQMMGHEQWQVRHAALMAVRVTAEGLKHVLEGNVAELIAQLEPLFQDPHRRVRWAACTAVGQICHDIVPAVQETAHAEVMRCVMHGLSDQESLKVRSHACAAIVNFCAKADIDVTAHYAGMLLPKLGETVAMNNVTAQEWALSAMGSIGAAAKSMFGAYLDTVMPLCMKIIQEARLDSQRGLRGRAFEAATFLALAVGREKFAPYLEGVSRALMESNFTVLSSDDPQVGFLVDSSARLAEFLGPEFEPFLQRLMPEIVKRATQIALAREDPNADRDQDSDDEVDDEWRPVMLNGQAMLVHAVAEGDKADALQAVARYAEHTKEAFFPYVAPVAKHVLETIENEGSERLRECEIAVLPYLMSSCCAMYQKTGGADVLTFTKQFANQALLSLAKWTVMESDVDFQHMFVQVIYAICEELDTGNVKLVCTTEELGQFIVAYKTLADEATERRAMRNHYRQDASHDAEYEEDLAQDEEEDSIIMAHATEMIEGIFRVHGSTFLPAWSSLVPLIEMWVGSDESTPTDVHYGLCLLIDAIEYGENDGLQYFDICMRELQRLRTYPNAGVQQAVMYGLGACAQCGGPRFAPFVQPSVKLLTQMFTSGASANVPITIAENAISATGKIILARPTEMDAPATVKLILQHLPIREDTVEAVVVNKHLIKFAELYPKAVFGESPTVETMARVLKVIGDGLETEKADKTVTEGFRAMLAFMKNTFPQDMLQAALQSQEEIPRARILRGLQ